MLKGKEGFGLRLFGIGILLLVICVAYSKNAIHADAVARGGQKAEAGALPSPGTYKVDPDHSFVYFSAWHHIVGVVRGRFDKTTGTMTVSQDPAACAVDITIDTSTINTQNSERDEDLRGPDFFNVKDFPTMTYHGQGIRRMGDSWVMDGNLMIRGVTKVVPVEFTFRGIFPDTKPGRPTRVAFHGAAQTRRGEFGMTRDNKMELGVPPAPGNDVDIEIDVEADASRVGQ
jgi:polyisoprenoid-binding protein YceI